LEAYRHVMRVAHMVIGEAFSNTVITPGKTTTEDVVWWMRQRVVELGLGKWFHPSVTIWRQGGAKDDLVIRPGDMLHTDFGIVYLGFSTDTQHLAYVLKPGETDAPAILAEAAKLAGAKPPSAENLKKYSIYGGRERMEKRDGRPAAGRDPRLGELLRKVIQKDSKPEEVEEAVRAVEEYIREKPDLQRQLGDITKSVVGSKGFADGGYGTEKAREQIRQWARKYAPGGS